MTALILRALPLLPGAIGMTLFLGSASFVCGSCIGLLIALARLSAFRLLRAIAFAYVSVFRGTPLLVQILLVYFGLPQCGIMLTPVPAAILALTLFSAAYLSENFRAGILAVDRGQWEAAASMGMPYWTMMKRIILPQGLRIAVPPVGSRAIALMKDTSLASIITVVELTRVADELGAATFRYLDMFIIVGVLYWAINQLLTFAQLGIEAYLGRHLR